MHEAVAKLWPEIRWIEDSRLRSRSPNVGQGAGTQPAQAGRSQSIPFTLLVPNCPITFMEHKRCVVHIARQSCREPCSEFMGRALPIDMDTVIAGAILADVGKLLEYEMGPTARAGRASEERRCVILLPASRWRWNAACPMLFATSSPPTRLKAIWSSAPRKPTSCIMPTSWRICPSRILKISD